MDRSPMFRLLGVMAVITALAFAAVVWKQSEVGAQADAVGQAQVLAAEVRAQLLEGGAAKERADRLADDFRTDISAVLSGRLLTDAQLEAVLHCLQWHRYPPYPDATDLEAKLATKRWAYWIAGYLDRERHPASPATEDLILRQIDELVGTMEDTIRAELPGEDASQPARPLRDILERYATDPVMPILKQPFTDVQLQAHKEWLRTQLKERLERWLEEKRVDRFAFSKVQPATTPVINFFYERVWREQSPPLSLLSPEETDLMRQQRREILRAKSAATDER